MEHAVERPDPWVTMWTQPRATVRQLIETDPMTRVVLVLAGLAGMVQMFDRASFRSLGDTVPLAVIFVTALLLGPVFGILSLYIAGALISWTGRWMGGSAPARHIRTAVAWAGIPTVASIPLWLLGIGIFGQELFTTATPRLESSLALSLLMFLFSLGSVALGIWSLVLLFKAVGEAQRFSAWKGLGNVLLAGLVIIAPVVVIGVVAALVIGVPGS